MSLQVCWPQEIPTELARLGAQLLDPGDPYRLIGDEASGYFRTQEWRFLYSERGRGAVCPIVLALVTLFQFAEKLPDREAAKQARLRIDWKYALHQELAWGGFHYSDLCNFRKRLLAHEAEEKVFAQVLAWVEAHGLVGKQSKQRSDSTHVLGCVERMSRLELVWESLRLTLCEMRQVEPMWTEQTVPAVFDQSYGQRHSDWRLSREKVKQELVQAGRDGLWLLAQIDGHGPVQVRELTAVATLRTVLTQQFEQKEDEVTPKPPPLKGKEILVSPHDPDARWAEKRGKDWVGYKLHVTETADPTQSVQFLTDVDLVAANTADSEQVDAIHARLARRELTPTTHYVDQGYTSGPNLAHSTQRGIDLRGPVGTHSGGKQPGYRQEDFALDLAQRSARCPQGQVAPYWSAYPIPDEPERFEVKIKFGSLCDGCAVRPICAPGRTGRTMTISAFHAELSERRREEGTEPFRQEMHMRSAIEGTISGLVRRQGARRARYRGLAKGRLQALFTAAATNLIRLANALVHPQLTPPPSSISI